jgi:serine/threonine-protein kinase
MAATRKIKGRYETQDVIGSGGMGLVYRAFDTVMKRRVALKTIRDQPGPAALELFRKECGVMAGMSHPNIVEIFDIGEFEENGVVKPFFVMPLLPGATLDDLIRNSSQRLTVDRAVDIILQTCRGLHAAHERGLVHRDLKPRNIFVMPDHSVKIIDFGVAHMADARITMTVKGGTLPYMAPEQIEMKPATPLSDLFSLGVVFYETVTRRRPFDFPTDQEVIQAILRYSPPPASEVNSEVSQAISRVIHKAMAKQPWSRFSSAQEFAEILQKAHRNEAIEIFDSSRIQPRIQRATRAFEHGNFQFAAEILSELEAEGHLDPAISGLRRQLDQAVYQKRISELLENARNCFEEEEYILALQKLQEVLQMESANSAALTLRAVIENRLNEQKVEEWVRLARQHLEHNAFSHARQALQNLLQIRPKDAAALQMLAEVDRSEQQYTQARQEKERLYQAAMEAWQNGEMSAAITKMERVIELDRRVPDTSSPDRGVSYQTSYEQMRSDHDNLRNAYQEARKHLLDGNFSAALSLCDKYLTRHPGHALFQALKYDVEERQRQELSACIAEIDRRVESEPDLERRVNILKEALEQYPGEAHFERALRLMRDRRDLVSSIISKARTYEENGQFNEALERWETLRTIHTPYPGLDFEIDRVRKRREQQLRAEAKARWVEQIDRQLESRQYSRALDLLKSAAAEFPEDGELTALEMLAQQGQTRAIESQELLAQGKLLCEQGEVGRGLECLRKAWELDERDPAISSAYVQCMLAEAEARLEQDWTVTDALSKQALRIDPANALARSLQTLALDRKKEEFVSGCASEARRLQAHGNIPAALEHVERGLADYPREQRLLLLRNTLRRALPDAPRAPAPAENADAVEAAGEVRPQGWTELEKRLQMAPPANEPAHPSLPMAFETGVTETTPSATAIGAAASAPAPIQPQPPTAPVRPSQPSWRQTFDIALRAVRGLPKWAVLGAAATASILIAAVAVWLLNRPVSVDIVTNPPGALIRIDNQPRGKSGQKVTLRRGMHRIEILKDGFQTYTVQFDAWRGSPGVLKVDLRTAEAAPVIVVDTTPSLQLSSDLTGKVALDDQPPVDLQNGEFSVDSLAPGLHTLKVASSKSRMEFSFHTSPGEVAALAPPLKSEDLSIVVVATAPGQARVYCNCTDKVAVNQEPKGQFKDGVLELGTLPEGDYELRLGSGRDLRTLIFTVGSKPVMRVSVTSGQNFGDLLVLTGEDGVTVSVDGKPWPKPTSGGKLQVSRLPLGERKIAVSKDGFQPVDPQTVVIAKGKQARVEFQMQAVITVASLQMRGLPVGASVLLDQKSGAIGSDGTFSLGDISPGDHAITVSAKGFKPKTVTKTFRAGETLTLGASDFPLESVFGKVRVEVTPADARVQYRSASSSSFQDFKGQDQDLEEGRYVFRASAANHDEALPQEVQVLGGKVVPVKFNLSRKAAAVPVATALPTMDEWARKAGWSREGAWYVINGGAPVLCPYKVRSLTFTAFRDNGLIARRIGWVTNYVDSRNYVLFQLDQNNLYRTEFTNGKDRKESFSLKRKYSTGKGKDLHYTIQVTITPTAVTHRLRHGNTWEDVDSYAPARDLSVGSVGFYLTEKDGRMNVSGIAFDR